MRIFGFLLLCCMFTLTSCAAIQPRKAAPITEGDLPALKGNWEGVRIIIIQKREHTNYVGLSILNDRIPLTGTVAIDLDIRAGEPAGSEVRRFAFQNGRIDPSGNLDISFDYYRMVLTFANADKKRLGGVFYHGGNSGTVTFYKK